MRVKRLKEILQTMPDDAFIRYIWDGEPRSDVQNVWLSKSGIVMISDDNSTVYQEDSIPINADMTGHRWCAPLSGEENYLDYDIK